MGYPQPQATRNAGSIFAAIAVLAAIALVLVGVIIAFGRFFFSSHEVPMSPSVAVAEYATTTEVAKSYSAADLTVEIDEQGQTYYHGESMPLEQIRPRIQEAMMHVATTGEVILVVEGCPFEYVENVLAMYKELGFTSPGMGTIPPYRTVTVTLDEQGKASIDGEPSENPQGELQEIVAKHGSRARVKIEADPKCPSQFVVQLTKYCRDHGFGDVQVKSTREQMAENSH
jgi:biopolymer transport protein ExbD